MYKKGLFGSLIIIVIAVIVVVVAIIYVTGHFGFKTDKFSVDIGYDDEGLDSKDVSIVEITENGNVPSMGGVVDGDLPLNGSAQNRSLNYTNMSQTN